MTRTHSSSRWLSASLLALALPVTAARAQSDWISPNGSPPDTPPTIEYLEQESDHERSVFHITLNGIWSVASPTQSGLFHRLRIPEHHSRRNRIGRPAAPRIGLTLRIPSTADRIEVGDIQVLASLPIQPFRVFPTQAPELELPDGQYERPPFEYDQGFYMQRQTPFPPQLAQVGAETSVLRKVRVQSALVNVVRTIPAQEVVLLDWDLRVEFIHPGQPAVPIMMTRRMALGMRDLLDNTTDTIPVDWIVNWQSYDACYLVVTPPEYVDELQPLLQLKREQGYRTTVLTIDDIGSTPDEIKTAIEDWYDDCDDQEDAYVLLVGDVDQLPMHTDPQFSEASDHYYACLDGGPVDLTPEVGLARISVDDETDCAEQVEKLVRYQEAPPSSANFYRRVLLAAHKEVEDDGSARYVEIMEEISAFLRYYTAFDVTERFGTEPEGLAALTLDDLSAGQNIAVYRGHGSYGTWSYWDYDSATTWASDFRTLTNGDKTGLVLSVACSNNGLDRTDDCLGETFMEGAENGAVAHYGSTGASYTGVNHDLAYWFMLSGRSYATLADGFAATWSIINTEWDDHWKARHNQWIYLLLGDPAMKLWSERPEPIFVQSGGPVNEGLPTAILEVLDGNNDAVEGVIVTLVQNDRMLGNRYTDASGHVEIPLEGLEAGELIARVYDDLGNKFGNRIVIPVGAACPADLDGDGIVGFGDILQILGAWGETGGAEDVDGNGVVDFGDLLAILAAWGPCP